jgi:uncharacterized membrane protein YqjE
LAAAERPPQEDGKPPLSAALHGLLGSGLDTLHTRISLFAVELEEEKLRAARFLFNTVLAALFIGFAVVALALLITVALWDSHRLLALGLCTAALLGAGIYTASAAKRSLRESSRLFAASLAELRADREALAGRRDTDA